MEEANQFLKAVFLPEFNHLHKVKPEKKEVRLFPGLALTLFEEILCIEEEA